jgi:hypothetical protein
MARGLSRIVLHRCHAAFRPWPFQRTDLSRKVGKTGGRSVAHLSVIRATLRPPVRWLPSTDSRPFRSGICAGSGRHAASVRGPDLGAHHPAAYRRRPARHRRSFLIPGAHQASRKSDVPRIRGCARVWINGRGGNRASRDKRLNGKGIIFIGYGRRQICIHANWSRPRGSRLRCATHLTMGADVAPLPLRPAPRGRGSACFSLP